MGSLNITISYCRGCERIVQTNPGFVVELTHSSDGNFQ